MVYEQSSIPTLGMCGTNVIASSTDSGLEAFSRSLFTGWIVLTKNRFIYLLSMGFLIQWRFRQIFAVV